MFFFMCNLIFVDTFQRGSLFVCLSLFVSLLMCLLLLFVFEIRCHEANRMQTMYC